MGQRIRLFDSGKPLSTHVRRIYTDSPLIADFTEDRELHPDLESLATLWGNALLWCSHRPGTSAQFHLFLTSPDQF
jgi:hypothetical protein